MARKRAVPRTNRRPRKHKAGSAGAPLVNRVAAIERECKRLERLLASDNNWHALQMVAAAEARGGVQPGARAKLEAELEDNALYRALRELRDAIAILRDTGEAGPPPETAATVDQFTLIRGIDAETATRLTVAGLRSFSDIARWSAADVKAITRKLRVGKRIHREGWIAQAAILAAGGRTQFAARPGDLAPVAPLPDNAFLPDRGLAARLDASRKGDAPRRPAGLRSMMAALQQLEQVNGANEAPSPGGDRMYDGHGDRRAATERGEVPMPEGADKGAPSTAPDAAAGAGAARFRSAEIDELADFALREVEEAEVTIIERPSTFTAADEEPRAPVRHQKRSARPGSLDARLKHSREPETFDALHYAGYQSAIDEAEVEIVRYDASGPGEDGEEHHASAASGVRRLGRRLVKSLTGR